MKKVIFFIFNLTGAFFSQSLKDKLKKAKDSLDKKTKTIVKTGDNKPKLTNEEVIKGLKEALSIGTNNSSSLASKADGYYKILVCSFLGRKKRRT